MHNFRGFGFLVTYLILNSTSYGGGRTLLASAGPAKVQLVELYSSESCSSCPPADIWISGLKDQTGLWKKFVPVVFHVDYWNNLGWKDNFSSDTMTKRQIDISKTWASASVYTPAFIVDGKEWSDWRKSAHHELPRVNGNQEITLKIFREDSGVITVQASGLKDKQNFIIRAALLGMDINSSITSGENSGAKLKHNFLILNWDSQPANSKKNEVQFQLKAAAEKSSKQAIAVWIEKDGEPTALQAAGGYL